MHPLHDGGPPKKCSGIGICLVSTWPQFMATEGVDVTSFMDDV